MAGQMYYQKFDLPTSISNSNLIKIIDFYLINCPVAGKATGGKHFRTMDSEEASHLVR